ncbi:unnamed protein product [Miscanthus lutarioriparius]|uniref:Uncharacterized protein n=1 Tax=Miscanthus lutarioriparius TaxID=422564 RepID=A0A811SEU2_9POAL|nr:unnamed protein product [Miscanthus lutarioriparius]
MRLIPAGWWPVMATVVPRVHGGAQLLPRCIGAARPRQQPMRPWRTRDLGGRMRWRLMVLLLKVHRAAGKLMGAASAALSVAAAARRWVAAGRTDTDAGAASHEESPAVCTRFYGFLCTSLVLSMLLLAADVAAHLQGWHLAVNVPDLLAVKGLFSAGYAPWVRIRLEYLVAAGCARRPHLATTPRGRRTQGATVWPTVWRARWRGGGGGPGRRGGGGGVGGRRCQRARPPTGCLDCSGGDGRRDGEGGRDCCSGGGARGFDQAEVVQTTENAKANAHAHAAARTPDQDEEQSPHPTTTRL